jgi:hypothetical protein
LLNRSLLHPLLILAIFAGPFNCCCRIQGMAQSIASVEYASCCHVASQPTEHAACPCCESSQSDDCCSTHSNKNCSKCGCEGPTIAPLGLVAADIQVELELLNQGVIYLDFGRFLPVLNEVVLLPHEPPPGSLLMSVFKLDHCHLLRC